MKRIRSQRYMKSGRKDKNFTKLEFVAKTQFLYEARQTWLKKE